MTGRKFNSGGLTVDAAVVFALFAVFTVSVLFVLISGANVYKTAATTISESYDLRTAEAYIASKIRHSDALGSDGEPLVAVKKLDDIDVLALYEEYDGGRDVTYIYYNNGYICELYTSADSAFDVSLGEKIIAAQELELSLDGPLLTAAIGDKTQINISLRCVN
jgi:hypothetical protein